MRPKGALDARRLEARRNDLPDGVAPGGTHGAILGAALRLFAERGFAGTSIRDIAAAAKVRSAALYSHYVSKERLLADLVEIGHREHHRQLRAALVAGHSDPRDQLAAIVRAHVTMHGEFPMLAVVTNAELHMLSAELAAPSLALRREAEQMIRDVVRRGVELGVFAPGNEWLAATAIGGMGMRVANWFPPQFALGVGEVADSYAEFALRIVGAKERAAAGHPTARRQGG